MDFLKIEQGNFFGIFIPGAFLLINIVYSMNIISNATDINILLFESGLSFENGLVGFVVTVILGFVLRMLPYEYSDWRRKSKFPFFDYYFNLKWKKFPKSFRDFYTQYFQLNYPDNKGEKGEKGEKGDNEASRIPTLSDEEAKYMINNFKVTIINKSSDLKSEVLFNEGASRLAVGTLYALVLSLFLNLSAIIICFTSFRKCIPFAIILAVYVILILVIYKRLPELRGKEVRTILEAYSQCGPNEINHDDQSQKVIN